MKKIKIVFLASASVIGLAASFAFSPKTVGGWRGGTQYVMGTGSGQYTCNAGSAVCTYQEKAQINPYNYGTFFLHP